MEDKHIQQQRRIDELEYSDSDLQQLSIELLTQKNQQQKRVEELQHNIKQQQLRMCELKVNNDKQQQRLDTLQENSNKQQHQIEELEDTVNCPVCFANRRRVIFRCGMGYVKIVHLGLTFALYAVARLRITSLFTDLFLTKVEIIVARSHIVGNHRSFAVSQ